MKLPKDDSRVVFSNSDYDFKCEETKMKDKPLSRRKPSSSVCKRKPIRFRDKPLTMEDLSFKWKFYQEDVLSAVRLLKKKIEPIMNDLENDVGALGLHYAEQVGEVIDECFNIK